MSANDSANDGSVVFTFEGRRLTAPPRTSIAAALAAHDVRTLSRGVKYHRPRGYTCGFSACGDCPLTVNGLPGVESCSREVSDGDVVTRELGWPNASFDVLRSADVVSRWIPAGFQFRLFATSPRLSRLAGRLLKHLAGGGRFPSPSASRAARVNEVEHIDADVVVVGAGTSGLQAALTAAEAGRSVILVERSSPTKRADVRTEGVVGTDGLRATRADALAALRRSVEEDRRIRTIAGVVFGVMDGTVLVDAGRTRWEIRPTHLVVATGSYETAPLFRDNDRPGVYLADGALKLRRESGRPLGARTVVATDSDRGHAVAAVLREQGDTVVRVLDTRRATTRTPPSVEHGVELERTKGWGRVSAVVYRRDGIRTRVRADALVLAFARRPADELVLQTAYAGEEMSDGPTLSVVGSASGRSDSDLLRTSEAVRAALPSPADPPTSPLSPPRHHPSDK